MKLTQTNRRRTRLRAGMTLLEMIISVGISVLVIGAAMTLVVFSAQTLAALGNYDDLNRESRNTLDIMTRDIRKAKHMTSFSTTQIVFVNVDGTTLSYTYNSSTGQLFRTNNGVGGPVLGHLKSLTFDISQRNPNNNFTFYSANGNPALAKLVDVNWECSLPLYYHSLFNTEYIQTAKIVVRN